jgi:hypothetical protein
MDAVVAVAPSRPRLLRGARALLVRPISRRTLALGLAILALNLVDAFATLRHLSHGAEELNPLMSALLRHGPQQFLAVKHALASLGVIGIAIHPQLRAARIALWILLPLYSALALYHCVLFFVIP